MSKARIAAAASIIAAACCFPVSAHAQATRTWVSGVGDDVNPCSRTAPCKTFPGAISKTAASGEINTLDPGGFGAVTIVKSMTIDGSTSGLAGVLASSGNAIVVNAASTDVVVLRNLEINGVGTGSAGILILGAKDVRIENCKIFRFSGGIEDRRTSGHLSVSNTTVNNNGQTGILAIPAGSSTLNVTIDTVQMHGNGNSGLAVTNGVRAMVVRSTATSNSLIGFYADTGATLDVDNGAAFGNGNSGMMALTGATIRLSNTTVTNNPTGLSTGSGSNILSYGSNRISGNAAGNTPSGNVGVQ